MLTRTRGATRCTSVCPIAVHLFWTPPDGDYRDRAKIDTETLV